jgi:hypothetical protein
MSKPARSLLLEVLREPRRVAGMDAANWELFMWHARSTNLQGHVWHLFERSGVTGAVPRRVQDRLRAATLMAEEHNRRNLWEANRVDHALRGLNVPIILLKGAAYAAAQLSAAQGRPTADIDIMVPKPRIAEVESALLAHGWEHSVSDAYDQSYYRRWMHEIPPLTHQERGATLDLHHAIVPLSSRLHLQMKPMYDAAIQIDGLPYKMLSPPDMLLHATVHLFHDGEIAGSLRDLVDIDALLQDFGRQPDFWSRLTHRAGELGLGRPLFYALRYAVALLDTSVPAETVRQAAAGSPSWPVLWLMDRLVPAALTPPATAADRLRSNAARFCLYVRSHWLRMPTGMLIAHLTRKSLRRWPLRATEA